ncbi:histone-lysine N-methyltransferase SETMAR-like [Stegodyphus dumicola]|uniref:histone-lysine N-methyltransferase SETMAR-like n=1 Tax=Stegodyphus dumicola TaxID=202533 RepID=UPI0015B2ACE4|nr:histone-lysine N-methyltransferase SETMAR-like [Stegodyphus dumicola]
MSAGVNECILANRRITVAEISNELDISHGSVHKITADQLQFYKVCAQWVPRLLTVEHEGKRIEIALKFLQCYQKEGNEFLDKIVTGDESWIHHFSPETKRSSLKWKHSTSQTQKKCRKFRERDAEAVFDREVLLHTEFMPKGATINSSSYCETPK